MTARYVTMSVVLTNMGRLSNMEKKTKKTFTGRVITAGEYKGKCVVSHNGLNTLATFQKSALKNAKQIIASDQNNPDVYGKNLTGVALCLPQTIGSTTGGLVIQAICSMKINPAALLFSQSIDSLAASGVLLASIWENSPIIAIDRLGDAFLKYAETGDTIEITQDGKVTVIKKEGNK